MPKSPATSLRVPVERLRRTCDPRVFTFRTTADLEPLEGTVGQDRAVSAMNFGLDIEADGFNLFVSGPIGSGRESSLLSIVDDIVRAHGGAVGVDTSPLGGARFWFSIPAQGVRSGSSPPCS